MGGIATIGAALRRVAGVSGVYGRKTPRVVAQSAVDLGGMRVTWGVWGVVDDGLGALVRGEAFLWCGVSGMSGLSACCGDDRAHCRRLSRGAVVVLMGEWWPVRAQAGPLGGGVDGLPGLPLVGLTCAVEGLVLPPNTPRRPPAMPRPPGPVWASDRSGAPTTPTTPTTPSVPRTPSGSGCLWEHSRAPSVRPKSRQGQERARQWPGVTRMGLRRSMRLTSPPRAAPERDGVRSSRASSSPSISHV